MVLTGSSSSLNDRVGAARGHRDGGAVVFVGRHTRIGMFRIRWSKLQTQIRDRLVPALRDRIALYQARYRRTAEEVGRVWLELDGEEIISFDTNSYEARRAEIEFQIRSGVGDFIPAPGSGY